MKQKLKVLMCSEASFINSGFGNYTRELLTRLHKTNKYEIAEFASYGMVNDPRDRNIHWKYYANAVRDNDPRAQEYSSRSDNQFGRWRFDKVLLDFRPNVVIDIRDYWMNHYQSQSPLRPFFNWVLMPTVDSAPQQESWIDTFLHADAVFTYSDWGAQILQQQSNNKINYVGTASPGVDLETFCMKPNRELIKAKYGLPQDSFVIGSVMRNQKRKLIPELLVAFRQLLNELENDNSPLANKTYLYLHTSYPDAGWDIPELLRQNRLLNKVYFSYHCSKCQSTHSEVYTHPCKVCKNCLESTSRFTSVTNGVSNETLSDIYNMLDIYVQYAICEGFGMPQVEAGACGVPIATVNYSAMEDVVHKLNAHPVKIKSYFKELETKAIRVYPDNNDLVKFILKFMRQTKSRQEEKRKETRKLTEKHYNWDNISKIWETFLDSEMLFTAKRNWDDPPKYLQSIQQNMQNPPKDNFMSVYSVCSNNLGDPSFFGTSLCLDILKDADYGFVQNGMNFSGTDISQTYKHLQILIDNHNQAEYARSSKMLFNEDFIEYSNIKSNT
jgi:glycosyltransferase involved in cell wall biosynthesis